MDDFTDHAEIRNSAKEEEKVLVLYIRRCWQEKSGWKNVFGWRLGCALIGFELFYRVFGVAGSGVIGFVL